VFLHIGAPKTGTTYLQNVLWSNRSTLLQAGVLYPGLSKDAQFHAAMDLRQAYFQEHLNPAVPGAWERLVAQARAWRGDVVISHELFSMLDVQVAQDALAHLGWAEVHLVCTARDLARQVPAVWQEDIKNRQVLSFGEFADELSTTGPATHYLANLFWQMQDIPQVLDTWAATLPPERVHLVTVPPPGAAPGELWSRFSQAIGIDSIDSEIDLGCEPNRSMGIAETNLLRRLNVALGDSLDWPAYDVLVKDFLALSVMGAHPSAPLALPLADHQWVATEPDGCQMNWGDRVGLEEGAPAVFGCYGQEMPAPTHTLEYGQIQILGSLSCDSETVGITCIDTNTGHYFFVSRDTVYLG